MQYIDLGHYSTKKNTVNKKKKFIKIFLIVVLVALIGYGSYILYWPISALIGQILKQPSSVLSFIKNPGGSLEQTDGRTNFLLLGIDKRSNISYVYKGPNGEVRRNGFLSDTIIILSVNRNTNDVAMISIPRDTWVEIPGWDGFPQSSGKINSAYSIGNSQNYPGGGLALAKKVVSETLDISIHYATRIDFEGFEKAINTLGGIDIIIERTFDDYNYPIEGKESAFCSDGTIKCRYQHVHFDKGPTHMDGTAALKFVRSRQGTNGEGNDFARAARQQKVLIAAREKSLQLSNLLDPFKIKDLFQDFGETIETDIDLEAVPAVFQLGKEINVNSIRTVVLDNSKKGLLYNPPSNDYGGAYVLTPRGGWEAIRSYIKEFLAAGNEATNSETAN